MAPVHSGPCNWWPASQCSCGVTGVSAGTAQSTLCCFLLTWLPWCSWPSVNSHSWYLSCHLLWSPFYPSNPSSFFSYSCTTFRNIKCWPSKGFFFFNSKSFPLSRILLSNHLPMLSEYSSLISLLNPSLGPSTSNQQSQPCYLPTSMPSLPS